MTGDEVLDLIRRGEAGDELRDLAAAGALHVTDSRTNGSRVDARFATGAGDRAWLAVVWTSATGPGAVESVTLFERPRGFEAEVPGMVVVLNGPSSAGKSSLMAAFADVAPTPWACLDEPAFGRLPARYLAWPETAGPARDGVLAALAAAARLGNQFLVSAAGIDQRRFRDALEGVPTVYVGLDAPLDVLVARQLTQADKFGGLAEESIGIHDGWEYDLRIDTVAHSPAEAAHLLAEHLEHDRHLSRP